MIIKDVNGYEKTIKDIKEVTYNRTNDSIAYTKENIDGELVTIGNKQITETVEKYVEVTVQGKNREWVEWYKMEKFIEMNPGVEI